MRTTLDLDEDVLQTARAIAGQMRVPFKRAVNEALRRGLKDLQIPGKRRKYRTVARSMGLKPGFNVDNIQELLAQAEGEDFR